MEFGLSSPIASVIAWRRQPCAWRFNPCRLTGMALVLVLISLCSSAAAQVVVAVDYSGIDDGEEKKSDEPKSPFKLPSPSADAVEAMEDFRRAVKNGTWEKAFKNFDKLLADTNNGLVDAKDGVKLPSRLAASNVLVQLPAAGKSAYRVFYDAKAKTLWEQVQKEQGKAEMENLSRLATMYLISSVGDLAANRLGDLLFEQGDMDGAIQTWQRVLEDRPDSAIPRVELLVKTATAKARARRWQELSEVSRQIVDRHAKESIVLAGEKKLAADYVAQ